jgi:hypothetical protein
MSPRAELAAALLATPVVLVLARRRPPALVRTAASGREVTLAAGPATVVGLLAAIVVDGRRRRRAGASTGASTAASTGASTAVPAAVGVLVAAFAGAVDDLAEPVLGGGGAPARGLAGHLRALRHGRVTTGAVKTIAIGAGALLAAVGLARARGDLRGDRLAIGARVVADSVVIAGTANLLNLFDLRPGRAGKVALLLNGALALTGSGPAPGVVGALVGTLPGDVRGAWMLGDTGANSLGAALGVRVAARGGPVVRAGWLALVLVLTAASERVSFTRVIADHRILRVLDELGRR